MMITRRAPIARDLPAELLPEDLCLFAIEVPDDAAIARLNPAPSEDAGCVEVGDAFLKAGNALVMLVCSVVVPQDWNALINVRHADIAQVVVRKEEPFRLYLWLLA
ncbi:RES family NAD+ phosphorylase [Sphingobium xenophagum]|uniref:RES family NAD+ phosphorylase n=1 Tax=Sphingobium xenophagum TaxID=121428 RepID=UPI001C0D2FD6|nr:RES family NAD+ phosphorylase [Sphingobium xenophagum]QWT16631.1 RES family NAD+ phosphorylase [Sphingobium xenophagum]